jgi:hypothetical protein
MIGQLQHLIQLQLIGYENLNQLFKTFQASFRYQCWTYLIANAFNHYQQQLVS